MNLKKLKRLVKQTEAVSPVVATLMLVLVAAGAAVGLNLFMNSFQEDATQDVGIPDGTQTLKIAGSSTVFELSKAALNGGDGFAAFEEFAAQAGTPIKVELEKGGSGAGRQAVGLCLIDIGSSSSDPLGDADVVNSWPDCNGDGNQDLGSKMEIFHVGYDTLAIVTDDSNTACTGTIQITEAQVYELYRVNGAGESAADIDGVTAGVQDIFGGSGPAGSGYTWSEIGTDADIPCAGAQVIKLHDRLDPGGTEEGFCGKVMKDGYNALVAAGATAAGADVTGTDDAWGCTSDDQLDDDAFVNLISGDGNQGIAASLTADSLTFIGAGHVQTAGGMTAHQLADKGTSDFRTHTDVSSGAPAVRSLYYLTAGEPSPVEQIWLDFILDPHRNQLINAAAGYVDIY